MSKYNLYIEDVSVEAVFNKLGGVDGAKQLLSGELVIKGAELVSQIFSVIVDYSSTLCAMIEAGSYNWVSLDINDKNFPSPKITSDLPQATINLELIRFNKRMSSEQVMDELKKQNLRPATLPELLAFGAKFPEKQRKYPLVALGSVWQNLYGRRRVPILYGDDDERALDLDDWDGDWDGRYRFLAVREVMPADRQA
ncbi:MAG: hypothetical protein Q8Q37_01845 [bacterium]|nr:hypothetical protein [bacterium]